MAQEGSGLKRRIEGGGRMVLAELWVPSSGDPRPVREGAAAYEGRVDGLVVSDNRDRVAMSAVAAAAVVATGRVEPILTVTTRDRNRIALISDFLGAHAMGIRNFLCTSGTHQTLGRARSARNVFDVDSIQLLEAYANLSEGASLVGESGFSGIAPVCLGAVATSDADPIPLQVVRVAKKVAAGAELLITQPVFDLDRFDAWLRLVIDRGLHRRAAVIAGIRILGDAQAAGAVAAGRPAPRIPRAILDRIASADGPAAQREAAIRIAVETVQRLCERHGLRGFCVRANGDTEAALEVLERSGLGTP